MKIQGTLISFLIVGILGSLPVNHGLQIPTMIIQSCHANGGQQAVDKLLSDGRNLLQCADSTLGAEGVARFQSSNNPLERLKSALLYCPNVVTRKGCLSTFMNSLKACYKPGQRKDFDIVHGMVRRVLDFICDNKEKIVDVVSLSAGQTCIAQQGGAALRCISHIAAAENTPVLDTGIGIISGTSWTAFDAETCRKWETAEKCVVQELSKCDDKLLSELTDSLFKSVNNELIWCKNLEKSYASPGSVVNIALLIAAIAISL